MLATGHQVMGITWAIFVLTSVPILPVSLEGWEMIYIFFLSVIFGAYLPDLDKPTSTIGRRVFPIALGIVLFMIIVSTLYVQFFRGMLVEHTQVIIAISIPVLLVFCTHRTWTHSLLFLGILVLYFQLLGQWIVIPTHVQLGIVVGVTSHLFGDYLTKQGIPLFYPFTRKRYRFILTFRTGSLIEKVLIIALLIFNVYWLV